MPTLVLLESVQLEAGNARSTLLGVAVFHFTAVADCFLVLSDLGRACITLLNDHDAAKDTK